MKNYILFSFLTLCGIHCCAAALDTALRRQLDTILTYDQRYREAMIVQPGLQRDSMARALGILPDEVAEHFAKIQAKLDSINLNRVETIIARTGYPGKTLVGSPANMAVFSVIQHSNKIKQYFPLLEAAGKAGELPFIYVAMMQDRMLKDEGKEQIYGSQYAGYPGKDSATGEQVIKWFLWPVKDMVNVNKRRKKAGFKDSVAENAKSQGFELHLMTLEEILNKCPWLLPQH